MTLRHHETPPGLILHVPVHLPADASDAGIASNVVPEPNSGDSEDQDPDSQVLDAPVARG